MGWRGIWCAESSGPLDLLKLFQARWFGRPCGEGLVRDRRCGYGHARGFVSITDRTKDVIKSGGEWISSIEVENVATGHPKVAEAAVIGRLHEKWGERPLLIVVKTPGEEPSPDELKTYLDGKIAKWWIPDDVQFIEDMPHTATGKIQKTALRDMFANYQFPA